jgi:hypothetical protein
VVRGRAGISAVGALALVGAIAVGSTLRLWNLGAQVLSGDEFHAVIAALDRPISRILFFYQAADNCIPLSVLDRLLIDMGAGLTEWSVRLPVLIAGFALLLLAPVWAWRRLGAGTAVALAWLVAISPGLVFYSRIARSYAPATLFGCAAVAAFETWHRRGGVAPAAAYVACTVMAAWFHLGALPLVLSPFLVAALALAAPGGRTRGQALVRLLLLGAGTIAGLAALLAPAHGTLLPSLAAKHDKLGVTSREAAEVCAWLAGVNSRWAAVALGLVCCAGLAILLRRGGWLGGFALGGVAVQVAGVLLLAPVAHQATVVLARYLVFALPCALVAVAVALGSPWPPRWRKAQPWLAAAGLAGLIAGGPFLDADLARSSFAHDELYLRFTAPRPQLEDEGPVAVYHWLAQAGPGVVFELPWDPVFMPDRILALYQTLHDREVVVGGYRPDARMRFRNMTSVRPQDVLASRARWLIAHPLIVREEARIGGAPWGPTPELRRVYRRAAVSTAATYRNLWGPPDYEDRWVKVWDLDRLRGISLPAGAPSGNLPPTRPAAGGSPRSLPLGEARRR